MLFHPLSNDLKKQLHVTYLLHSVCILDTEQVKTSYEIHIYIYDIVVKLIL